MHPLDIMSIDITKSSLLKGAKGTAYRYVTRGGKKVFVALKHKATAAAGNWDRHKENARVVSRGLKNINMKQTFDEFIPPDVYDKITAKLYPRGLPKGLASDFMSSRQLARIRSAKREGSRFRALAQENVKRKARLNALKFVLSPDIRKDIARVESLLSRAGY